MTQSELINLSKFLAYILRHNPSAANISLDENGWAEVDKLIAGINTAGRKIDIHMLEQIVREDKKNRYSFNKDKSKIRANQGHSVDVEVDMTECAPPDILYHGTAKRFLESIKEQGILRCSRRFVHLSGDIKTAFAAGSRHGKPIVLVIDAKQMVADGYRFYLSSNGVWQSADIPWKYVKRIIDKNED